MLRWSNAHILRCSDAQMLIYSDSQVLTTKVPSHLNSALIPRNLLVFKLDQDSLNYRNL